jgi:hypothetical protein
MFVIMEGGFLIPTYVKESTIKGIDIELNNPRLS